MDEFVRKMKVTAQVRFVAASRLAARDRCVSFSIAVASALVLILTIAPYIVKTLNPFSDALNFASVVGSIFIICASLFQYSASDALAGEQHHRCALEINEIVRDYEFLQAGARRADKDIIAIYNLTLQKYSINHSTYDYIYNKIYNGDKDGVSFTKIAAAWAHKWWPMGILMLLIAVSAAFIVFVVWVSLRGFLYPSP